MNMFSRDTSYDVIITGGGVAGIGAAISAARNGANTLLIEQYGYLGGTATASLVGPWMRYTTPEEQLITGVFEELRHRMLALGGVRGTTFDFETLKFVAQEMVLEAGARLLFHSQMTDCAVEQDIIKDIEVFTKAGKRRFSAPVFIDATGDGDLAARAGTPYHVGRESDGLIQGMTLMFTVGGVDFARVFDYFKNHPDDYIHWEEDIDYEETGILCRAGFFSDVKKAQKEGTLDKDIPYLFFISIPKDDIVVFNTTHVHGLNPLDPWDVSEAEVRLRRQVWQILELLPSLPGFEKSYLLQTAPRVGVRESRHFEGHYTFTGDDVRKAHKFDDVIARGNYGVDVHAPAGEDEESFEVEEQDASLSYDIPYKSLLPAVPKNLLIAGRCIVADHLGQSAMRIQPICIATGQAAGAAAALCVKENNLPAGVDVKTLQSLLVEQGANLGNR